MELALVPQIPIMLKQAEVNFPNETRRATDLCSNIYTFTFSIGQLLGPIYGGYLTGFVGYRTCCDSVGMILVVYSILFFIFGHVYSKPKDSLKNKTEILETVQTERKLESFYSH